jgi:hypothetical protein
MGLVGEVPDSILKMTDNRHARLALAAFVISTLVIAVGILIVSFSYDDKGLHFSIPTPLSLRICCLLLYHIYLKLVYIILA